MEENKSVEKVIDETVEEMKQKIDEISKGAELIEDADLAKKANEVKEKAVEVFGKVIEKLQSAYKNAADSKELEKAVEFVKTKSKELADVSLKKIEELKNDEKVKKALDNVNNFAKDTTDHVVSSVQAGYETLKDNDAAKKVLDKTEEVLSSAKKSVDEFIAKPEVKEAAEKVKEAASSLYDKAMDSLKEWLNPDKKDGE